MTTPIRWHTSPVHQAADVIEHIHPGTNIVVPLANGEPATVLDAIEAHADQLHDVRIHQMHTLRDRPSMRGELGDHVRHVSYFLSPVTRPHFAAGTIDFVPANFSEVPILMRRLPDPLLLVAASPPDRHGFFSLGTNCDYVASMIGRAPVFVEANRQMPRTFGRTQIHLSQVAGWCEADYPLHALAAVQPDEIDCAIGSLIAARIPDGATIQTGIGAIPNAVLASLRDHSDLGVHTELFSDGLMELVDLGVINGVRKQLNRTKAVATFALGTPGALRVPAREPSGGAVARSLRQRSPHHRPGGGLRVDQRDARSRSVRAVRLGIHRQQPVLGFGRPVRLRPRRDVLQAWQGFHRVAIHHPFRRRRAS